MIMRLIDRADMAGIGRMSLFEIDTVLTLWFHYDIVGTR